MEVHSDIDSFTICAGAGLALPKWDATVHGAAALEADRKIRAAAQEKAANLSNTEWYETFVCACKSNQAENFCSAS